MAEYIDRSKLEFDFRQCNSADSNWTPQRVVQMIHRQPIADVAPVVTGRWVEKDKYTFGVMYDCSICDNRILDTGHSWNYCPNCGARMDDA